MAFRVAYFGGEPAAAPHPRVFTPTIDSNPDPVALARAHDATVSHAVALRAEHKANVAAPYYTAEVEARGGDALFRADRPEAPCRPSSSAAASGCSGRDAQRHGKRRATVRKPFWPTFA